MIVNVPILIISSWICPGLFPHDVELLVRAACPADERRDWSGTFWRGEQQDDGDGDDDDGDDW